MSDPCLNEHPKRPGVFALSVSEEDFLLEVRGALALYRKIPNVDDVQWWAHPEVHLGLVRYRNRNPLDVRAEGRTGYTLCGIGVVTTTAVPGLQLRFTVRRRSGLGWLVYPANITVFNEEAWPLSGFRVVTPEMQDKEQP